MGVVRAAVSRCGLLCPLDSPQCGLTQPGLRLTQVGKQGASTSGRSGGIE